MSDVIACPQVGLLMPHPKQEQGHPAGAQCMRWWQVVFVGFMCMSTALHIFQHLELQRLDTCIAQQNEDRHSIQSQVFPEPNVPSSREKRHVVPGQTSGHSSTQNPLSSSSPMPPHRLRHPFRRRMLIPITTVDHFEGRSMGESNHHSDENGLFKQWDKAHWSTGNTTYDRDFGTALVQKPGIYLLYVQVQTILESQDSNETGADSVESPPRESSNPERRNKWIRFIARHTRWAQMMSGFKVMRQRPGHTAKAVLECVDSVVMGSGRLSRPCVGITTVTLGKGDWIWIENKYGSRTIDTHRASTHWGLIYQGPSQ